MIYGALLRTWSRIKISPLSVLEQCDLTHSGLPCRECGARTCCHVEMMVGRLLIPYISQVSSKHPSWSLEQKLQGKLLVHPANGTAGCSWSQEKLPDLSLEVLHSQRRTGTNFTSRTGNNTIQTIQYKLLYEIVTNNYAYFETIGN